MATQYTWLTFAQARLQLAQRLADTGNRFWLDAECGLYIIEALRTYNALTATWVAEIAFTADSSNVWYSVPSLTDSPRARSVTDTQIFTMMEYHLLEPATGGTWTGTPQFSMSDLSGALQRRRDEIIQMSGCNLVQSSVNYASGTRRTFLPDNTLGVLRARQVPVAGDPVTLWRGDGLSFEYFDSDYLQQPGFPVSYDVMSVPPLAIDVDREFNVPGSLDMILLRSGAALAPPTPTIMEMPNDWTWVAKWGALGDLLGRESEATDVQRAAYAMQRYTDGVALMQHMPWLLYANVDEVPVDTPSMIEMDQYSVEWDSNPSAPQGVVSAGIDYIAVSPVPTGVSGVLLTMVGNAPIPTLDADYVQVSRDTIDAILDYAQHLAAFKQGGQEFAETKSLAANFIRMAMAQNRRLADLGLFRDILLDEGQRQFETQERFQTEDK